MRNPYKALFIAIGFGFCISLFVFAGLQTTYSAAATGRARLTSRVAETSASTALNPQSVFVENSEEKPALIRDVDNAARHAFQQEVKVTLKDGASGANGWVEVPAGKRVVIEHVSAFSYAPSGQKILFSLMTQVYPDLTMRKHLLQTGEGSFGNQPRFLSSQLVRLYSGSSWGARVDRDSSAGEVEATFVVSGYILDLP